MRKARLRLLLIILSALTAVAALWVHRAGPAWAMERLAQALRRDYGIGLTASSAGFTGLRRVTVDSLAAVAPDGDTLLYIDRLHAELSFFGLLTGRHPVERLHASRMQADPASAWRLARPEKSAAADTARPPDLGLRAQQLLRRMLQGLPAGIDISRCEADLHRHGLLILQDFNLARGHYKGSLALAGAADTLRMGFEGRLQRKMSSCTLVAVPEKPGTAWPLPMPGDSLPLKLAFDTVAAQFDRQGGGGRFEAGWSFRIVNPSLAHWRIGQKPVASPLLEAEGLLFAAGDAVGIDSGAVFRAGALEGRFSVTTRPRPPRALALSFELPWAGADTFFGALPQGLFDRLRGLKASGRLQYTLRFAYDAARPDTVVFESDLERQRFRIRSYGGAELGLLNDTFTHRAAFDGRRIHVGPANPAFTPLRGISPYLVHAVLVSEDGAFFGHEGFNEEAFREALLDNIKARRFARGGSTVSMQLVKNIYLSGEKNIARKAEEALITWLIEKNRLVPKERMLEVYLNIIEWGPGV
jgi:hypothetical protein